MQGQRKGKKIALYNLGCKVNAYELEAMRQQLIRAGCEIVPFAPGADAYIVNTCTVTNIADRKSRQMLHRAKTMNPDALVVAVGCYVQTDAEKLKKDPLIDLLVDEKGKSRISSILEQALQNRTEAKTVDPEPADPWALTIDRSDTRTRAFLKVQDGCDRFCSYCIIPYARGRSRSRPLADVVSEAERLASSDCQEIVLTGIHLCSYGLDREDTLLDLIRAVHAVPGLARLRLGSLEPGSITETFIDDLAALPKLCPHFHLSLQSGCDDTLRRMNRRYTTAEYRRAVEGLRARFEEPAITTDIIVGFPGETEQDFEVSFQFVREIGFFDTHIFPYSRREGTKAATLPDQIPETEKRRRAALLAEWNQHAKPAFLNQFLQRDDEVLVEERTEIDGKLWWVGHTPRYAEVLLPGTENRAGERISIRPQQVWKDRYLLG